MTDTLNTLLVDGTDLRTVSGIVIAGDMNLYAPGVRRGDDDVVPGRAGQLAASLPYDAYTFAVPIIVLGADRPARESILRNLGTLLAGAGGDGIVTLTRRLAKTGGGYDSHTAIGRFIQGVALQLINDRTGQTELQFKNLEGRWYDAATSTYLVP